MQSGSYIEAQKGVAWIKNIAKEKKPACPLSSRSGPATDMYLLYVLQLYFVHKEETKKRLHLILLGLFSLSVLPFKTQ